MSKCCNAWGWLLCTAVQLYNHCKQQAFRQPLLCKPTCGTAAGRQLVLKRRRWSSSRSAAGVNWLMSTGLQYLLEGGSLACRQDRKHGRARGHTGIIQEYNLLSMQGYCKGRAAVNYVPICHVDRPITLDQIARSVQYVWHNRLQAGSSPSGRTAAERERGRVTSHHC